MKTRIKKLSFLSVVIAGLYLILAESANGQSGDYNGFEWSLNGNPTIQITGNDGTLIGAIAIPRSIPVQTGTNPNGSPIYTYYPVTSIGDYAFYECTSLTSVTIPNSVTSIGYEAFNVCTNLASVTIPNSVTSIGGYAFADCSSLTSVTIPNSVTSIGEGAFAGCTGLTSVTIPNSVTSIGYEAFWACTGLTSVTIPNSVTSIGSYAFSECTSLTSVTIPNSVTSIGVAAFSNCTGLTSVTIPNSVTSIGDAAFSNCTGLRSVTIPNSVTSIGDYAFSECTSLTSVTIPNSVTSIGYEAFNVCTSLTSVTIPNSVTNIGDAAFWDCYSLTSVTIPNSVTSIGYDAFSDCFRLTSVTIPNSVTSIGASAFWDCTSLTSVTIPNSVTSIGAGAFSDCISLTNVCFEGNAPSYGGSIFFADPVSAIYYINGTIGWGATFSGVLTAPCAQCGGGFTITGRIYCTCDGSPISGASVIISNNPVGNFSATSDSGGSYTINGIPSSNYSAIVSKTNYYTITTNLTILSGSTTVTQDFLLTPLPALNVSLCRVSSPQADVSASDDINAPIKPKTFPIALATASPLGLGVVADEVTPVLFQFNGTATNYTISLTHNALNYTNGPFSTNLFVLQSGAWQPSTNFAISSAGSTGTAYAYLQGLRWTDFTGAPAGNLMTVTLTVALTNGSVVASTNFLVFPPPVGLFHGCADDNTAWSSDFLNTLALYYPTNFIIPVQYGVGSGTKAANASQWPNATWPFDELSTWLDAVLATEFEEPLDAQWAFTRYDVVGHSQGGVLLRMLCQVDNAGQAPFSFENVPVVSAQNFFRGRFRRVITLGSPHNGSIPAWYNRRMRFALDRKSTRLN